MPLRRAYASGGTEFSRNSRPEMSAPYRRFWRVLYFSLTGVALASQADALVGFVVGHSGPSPIRGAD
jgi:hypothetical protein